ncbi:MAG: hypothetical protein WA063_07110 [Minisyncoccia bacterium]
MKSRKKRKLPVNKEGFSLMEIIIAIGIIVIGVLTVISLFAATLKSEIRNKNKVIGVYLAQEAIEIVRQNRDNVWFGGDNNFLDSNNPEFADGEVIVFPNDEDDITQGWSFEAAADDSYKKVYIKNGYYIQENYDISSSADDSGFERYVEIINNYDGGGERCDVNNCVKLIAIVSYRNEVIASVDAFLYGQWY